MSHTLGERRDTFAAQAVSVPPALPGSPAFPQDLQLPSLERAAPAAAGSPVQGSRGSQPVFDAWVLARSLVSLPGSKRVAFPDRYLIPELEGSWEAAESLLHRSHRHAAPSVPKAPRCRAVFYGTVVSASSLFPPFASPFLEATSSPRPAVY